MVRFSGKVQWGLLAAGLCILLPNATAQEPTPSSAPWQKSAPTPQGNQASAVARTQNSRPAQPPGPAQTLNSESSQAGAAPGRGAQVARSTAQKKQTAADPVAENQLPPPTLEQTPPSPPHVSYQNGQLSID